MPPSKPINLRLSQALREALDEYCAQTGREMSAVIREALCEAIGRSDVADSVPPAGRPKNEPEPPPPPKPKRKRNR